MGDFVEIAEKAFVSALERGTSGVNELATTIYGLSKAQRPAALNALMAASDSPQRRTLIREVFRRLSDEVKRNLLALSFSTVAFLVLAALGSSFRSPEMTREQMFKTEMGFFELVGFLSVPLALAAAFSSLYHLSHLWGTNSRIAADIGTAVALANTKFFASEPLSSPIAYPIVLTVLFAALISWIVATFVGWPGAVSFFREFKVLLAS